MYNFFVAFLGVFYAGQATAQVFMFSTSKRTVYSLDRESHG